MIGLCENLLSICAAHIDTLRVASEILSIFRRFPTSPGPKLKNVLAFVGQRRSRPGAAEGLRVGGGFVMVITNRRTYGRLAEGREGGRWGL